MLMFLQGQTKRKRIPTSSWNVGIPFLNLLLPYYVCKVTAFFRYWQIFKKKNSSLFTPNFSLLTPNF